MDARVTLIEPVPSTSKRSASPITTPSKKRRTPAKSSPAKSPRKPKAIKLELDTPHPAPERWEECLEILTKQRATLRAPVDTMGCTEAGKLESEEGRVDTDARVSCVHATSDLI